MKGVIGEGPSGIVSATDISIHGLLCGSETVGGVSRLVGSVDVPLEVVKVFDFFGVRDARRGRSRSRSRQKRGDRHSLKISTSAYYSRLF